MKIITLHKPIQISDVHYLLQKKLNLLFHERRQSDIDFIVEQKDGTVEISQPGLYEGFLFRITINGTELWITRSEHYVDDVNSLTLESILNDLFDDLSDNLGTDLVQEG
ncbi:hypothetical protein SAMN05216464_12210 [Mucilaginibacter pineti]|uniref:Uncharacterized protein n=1 Tax=Mucilaginibacter pineti TaxID=1391627 RepID=A0A1G7MLA3_9SPHI|nr:hypothetical protein [Mucilaginibacter pineti]SDF62396.1 hypothetical protein SAMN05216464_12210 [Mucilaginibacter pineti]